MAGRRQIHFWRNSFKHGFSGTEKNRRRKTKCFLSISNLLWRKTTGQRQSAQQVGVTWCTWTHHSWFGTFHNKRSDEFSDRLIHQQINRDFNRSDVTRLEISAARSSSTRKNPFVSAASLFESLRFKVATYCPEITVICNVNKTPALF